MIYFVKAADDGDGHTDEKTVEILTAVPTSTPTPTPTPPVFEAVKQCKMQSAKYKL